MPGPMSMVYMQDSIIYSLTTLWGRSHFTDEEAEAGRGRVIFLVSFNSKWPSWHLNWSGALKAPLFITESAWDAAVARAQESDSLGLNVCALQKLMVIPVSIGLLWEWNGLMQAHGLTQHRTRPGQSWTISFCYYTPVGATLGAWLSSSCMCFGPGPGTNLLRGQRETCVWEKLWNCGWYGMGRNKNQEINFHKVPF